MAYPGNNHAFSGRYNRRLVFDLIRTAGVLSRSDLVNATGLQPQTITNITKDLLERGLISEEGRLQHRRGAPQKLLRLNHRAGCALGIHLDRKGITAVACDLAANALASLHAPMEWNNPEASLDTIAHVIADLTLKCEGIPVWGTGIAMPTLQEAGYEEYVGAPGWQSWSQIPVADRLEARCGIPVIVENDATAAAIAERHAGAASGLTHYVYIFVGHGLGAGIIIDGLPFQGAFNNAGEIGMICWPPELTKCPRDIPPFSLEELATTLNVDLNAVEKPGYLEKLYVQRDSHLMSWLECNSKRLRILISVIENMFDPQKILIGGYLPSALFSSLVDRTYPLLPSVSARKTRDTSRLESARLGVMAPAIGAALLPVIAHGSPHFRQLSLMRTRTQTIDPEVLFDRIAGKVD